MIRSTGGEDLGRTLYTGDAMRISSPKPIAIPLAQLHSEIRACRKCELAGHLWEAHPIAGGSPTARVLVIGQAPGIRSMMEGGHFRGPGGKLLREWLQRGGVPLERQDEVVYFTSLTRCYPGPAPRGGAGDRKPSPPEVTLCEPYLTRELELLAPPLVLLVGSMAIERYLGRGPLHERVGALVEARGTHWLPLPHPSGVSRWLNNPEHKQLVEQALVRMRSLVKALRLIEPQAPTPLVRSEMESATLPTG